MKEYVLNLKFNSEEELRKWEEENLPDRKYNGECILMVNSCVVCGENEVILESITTI